MLDRFCIPSELVDDCRNLADSISIRYPFFNIIVVVRCAVILFVDIVAVCHRAASKLLVGGDFDALRLRQEWSHNEMKAMADTAEMRNAPILACFHHI